MKQILNVAKISITERAQPFSSKPTLQV